MLTSSSTHRATCATRGGAPAERAIRGVLTPAGTLEIALSAGDPSQAPKSLPLLLKQLQHL
jgi:hypothetical protein